MQINKILNILLNKKWTIISFFLLLGSLFCKHFFSIYVIQYASYAL